MPNTQFNAINLKQGSYFGKIIRRWPGNQNNFCNENNYRPADIELQGDEPNLAALIPNDGFLLKHLLLNLIKTCALIDALPEEKLAYRYAEGKWTIKEILIHVIDMERIYGYRMLCIAGNAKMPLPGFDDQMFVENSGANFRDVTDLLEELSCVRHATIHLLSGLTEKSLLCKGTIDGSEVSVRALAYHIAGHEVHHINIIKSRYLNTN